MRGTWILGMLAGLAIAGSCILPAATVSGTGGSGPGTSGSSSGTTSSGSSTAPPPPEPALPITIIVDDGGPQVVAPTGNPGQRHLIWASGAWWVFRIGSVSGTGGLVASTTAGPEAGGP